MTFGWDPELQQEVDRLAEAMYRGDSLIVSTRPDALAQATQRTVGRLRGELEDARRHSEKIFISRRKIEELRAEKDQWGDGWEAAIDRVLEIVR